MKTSSLKKEDSLLDAVKAIEESPYRAVVVIDEDGTLLGTLTDGDIRRSLLNKGDLNIKLENVMNKEPITVEQHKSFDFIFNLMQKANVLALPIVDSKNKFIKLIHLKELSKKKNISFDKSGFSFAVIMAGGKGKRLRPLTNNLPKPMIEIDGIPLLERQINKLSQIGIKKIYISINYLSDIIENYFKDGSNHGVQIRYLKESEQLGTAGSLSLLPEKPKGPILVMNGDVLTNSNFRSFYEFHIQSNAFMTVSAIDFKITIPYGVIREEKGFIQKLEEKPSQGFFCNAGIYSISPICLELITKTDFFNMTDLIELCLSKKHPVAVFPIHEYWSDIGTPNDLEQARNFFINQQK